MKIRELSEKASVWLGRIHGNVVFFFFLSLAMLKDKHEICSHTNLGKVLMDTLSMPVSNLNDTVQTGLRGIE
jgi:hypothetical protein